MFKKRKPKKLNVVSVCLPLYKYADKKYKDDFEHYKQNCISFEQKIINRIWVFYNIKTNNILEFRFTDHSIVCKCQIQ